MPGFFRQMSNRSDYHQTCFPAAGFNFASNDKDFALAKKIEEVVMWDAAATTPGVFEGTPDDPRFKYIKQDK
jgi:hypothetical protein